MSEGRRRFGFVLPRFYPGVAGGAETLAGELALRLAARGDSIEILTTCARDHRTWENDFPPGREAAQGLIIERFPVDQRDVEAWLPLQISISEGMKVEVDDQLRWMGHSVNSSGLYAHLAAHADDYDAVFLAPYLFGTTFWGSLIAPARSVLIPCLHDEPYAYQEIIASMFRQVRGALFNSAPEAELARRLYGPVRGGEVGMGFESVPAGELDQLTPFFDGEFPYIVYVGRKELGKNVSLLLDLFVSGKESALLPPGLKLVVAGGGSFSDLHRDDYLTRGDIIDLEHLSERDKRRLIRHAVLLAQPSTNESFSIVLMEAWRLGVPVIVHGGCAVTRDHAVRSGGGLYFTDLVDLCGSIRRITEDQALRSALAAAGERYVRDRYSWPAVLQRFDGVLEDLELGKAAAGAATPTSA